MRAAALVLLALLLAGCGFRDDPVEGPTRVSASPPGPEGPPLRFGGTVLDAVTGARVAEASVRLDLSQVQPCARQGIGWRSWDVPIADGAFGPFELPRPRSNDVAFFLHVTAPGYSENATHIGPQQARGDIGNMTVLLHPDAAIDGRAPPGTLLALDAPGWPRIAVADAEGAFSFPHARAAEAELVAAVDVPERHRVRPPATLEIAPAAERGWVLEGHVRAPSGAPLATDVVAWNGTTLWSVARSSAAGSFALPLPPEPVSLRVEARTPEGHLGGLLRLDLRGPPAVRESILTQPLC